MYDGAVVNEKNPAVLLENDRILFSFLSFSRKIADFFFVHTCTIGQMDLLVHQTGERLVR